MSVNGVFGARDDWSEEEEEEEDADEWVEESDDDDEEPPARRLEPLFTNVPRRPRSVRAYPAIRAVEASPLDAHAHQRSHLAAGDLNAPALRKAMDEDDDFSKGADTYAERLEAENKVTEPLDDFDFDDAPLEEFDEEGPVEMI
jgi:hypothetical protein